MRHTRFDIATLEVEGVTVAIRAGYLLVAEVDDGDHPQWEVIAYGLDDAPLPQGRYQTEIVTLGGRVLTGEAVVVRSVEGAHVLRGAGRLAGIAADDLG